MNLPVKQHIVPQTHLKQFSSGSEKIWLYQKDNKHFREQSIKKVPIVKDFYTVTDEEKDEKLYDLEKFLANQIEPLYPPYIEQLQKREVLNNLMKKQFAYFVSSQKLRTVGMKEKIINEIETAFRKGEAGEWFDKTSIEQFTRNFYIGEEEITYEEFLERADGKLEEVTLDISEDCFVQFIPEKITEFAGKLAEMNWSYLIAPKHRYFITSDNPVILESEIADSNFSIEGGVFPLTPHLALNIGSSEERFKKIGAKDVRKINEQIVKHSDRFIFSHNERFLKSNIQKFI
ncbi:DUF4238 domain-containing protein [Halobacillus sp. B29]|uniref:DUF4238 domain-containing protein n=1 Tax=Halobacillus sp. B29 TaxID=3457432 RepID=UPI003FCDFA3E